MTKNFILSRNPELFIKSTERDYAEMISGTVTEAEAYEYVSNLLPLARACNNNKSCWFWLVDEAENMPSDIRVVYMFEPAYRLAATIMYAMTEYKTVREIPSISYTFEKILNGCMARNFQGHGFDNHDGFIYAMNIFANANISKFLSLFGKDFPAFNEYFIKQTNILKEKYLTGVIHHDMIKSITYTKEAFDIIRKLEPLKKSTYIFVYGTLMKGQPANHLLNDAGYIGKFRLADYAMYNLGAYPGIKEHKGESVIGELYEINDEILRAMDSYEGTQYKRNLVTVTNSDSSFNAYAYIYIGSITNSIMREEWAAKDTDAVWYACYGSNLSYNRFNCYIEGGFCKENGKTYVGCKDNSRPFDQKLRNYPGKMYYGNSSASWNNLGVSFFNPDAESKTIMRLYKISREQLHDIQKQEGSSANWYGKMVCLDVIDDCPVFTLTSESVRPENKPSGAYINMMKKALVEECCIGSEEAEEYLTNNI